MRVLTRYSHDQAFSPCSTRCPRMMQVVSMNTENFNLHPHRWRYECANAHIHRALHTRFEIIPLVNLVTLVPWVLRTRRGQSQGNHIQAL